MIMRFGLPGHEIRINGSIYYAMVRFCCTLPGWALLIWFWFLMRRSQRLKKFDMQQAERRGKTEKHAKYRNWLWKVLFFAVMAGGAAALLWYGFRFPGEFIPSRWSDFSFYAEKFTQVKENLFDIAMLPKTRWDVEMIRAFAASVFCSASAAALIIITGSLLLSMPDHTGQE